MNLYILILIFLSVSALVCYIGISGKNELIRQLRHELNELNEERKLWVNKALVREHQGRIFVDKHAPVTSAEIIQQQTGGENLTGNLKADDMLPPYTAAIQSWIAEDEKAKQQKFQISKQTKEDILAGLDDIESSNGNH